LYEEISADLARPRERNSAEFEQVKRAVLHSLDRSLERETKPVLDDMLTAGAGI
jgi:sulfonate transport system ATP-binding protein